jgi:hypothetical protein
MGVMVEVCGVTISNGKRSRMSTVWPQAINAKPSSKPQSPFKHTTWPKTKITHYTNNNYGKKHVLLLGTLQVTNVNLKRLNVTQTKILV